MLNLYLIVFRLFRLQIFQKTSMKELVSKSRLLTGYLEARILQTYPKKSNSQTKSIPNGTENSQGDSGKHVSVEFLTPSDLDQRGAQLSMSFSINISQLFDELMKRGVVVGIYLFKKICAQKYFSFINSTVLSLLIALQHFF